MTYRLSLDLGTNSIGWAQLSLNDALRPENLLDGGVHIFDQGRNPTSLASNAADRRQARGLRRNRDRKLRRKHDLLAALRAHGLFPAEAGHLALLDPYELRTQALTRRLSAHEFGRALFHLHQRRGFRSNRKSDGGEDGKIAQAVAILQTKLAEQGHETYGAFLAARRTADLPTRLRLQGDGAKASYEFYPNRALIKAEFDRMFERQRRFGLIEANEQAQNAIEPVFFRQRKLKSPPAGRCSLIPAEERASKSLPTAQLFRIWSEVLNLRVLDARQVSRNLTAEEQDKVVAALRAKTDMKFQDLAEKTLKLPAGTTFNLQSPRRPKVLGDQTAAKFRSAFKKHKGPKWDDLPLARQDEVVETLLSDKNDEDIQAWLKVEFGFDDPGAAAIAALNPSPDRLHLSKAAMGRLLEVMQSDRLPYDEATQAAGLGHHSDKRTGEVYDTLPYYGEVLAESVIPGINPERARNDVERFGRFPNPTVHIVLGRIRALVNALIARDGKPAQIIIESGRELPLSAIKRRELESEQRKNTAANDKRAAIIESHGMRVTADRLLRLALHEELAPDYRCPFSGDKISQADIFSDQIEVEHILPYARTLDDSRANKTLATREANRRKAGRSPHEAFHDDPWFEGMMERVQALPKNKRWRFGAEAMRRFAQDDQWLARQLTDTQYIARLAVQYLTPVCATFAGNNMPCWATPGRLTAAVRHTLGLDEVLGVKGKKNRNDHRHHFVDACVIGLMDRGFLQEVAKVAKRSDDEAEQNRKIHHLVAEALGPLKEPLRAAVAARAKDMVIAHRPDHSKGGGLLKETAYGFVNKACPALTYDPKNRGDFNVGLRVAFPGDKFKKAEDLAQILSANTHARLHSLIMPRLELGESFADAAKAVAEQLKIRKIRIGLRETVEPISVQGKITKGYASGGNWCYDFYDCPHNGFGAELINLRQANSRDFTPEWKRRYPEAKRLFRLFGGDMIEIDDPRAGKEGRAIFRIQKMTAGKITLCDPKEANADQRNRTEGGLFFAKSPKPLVSLGLRKLYVSVLGEVKRS